eukprot:Rmarinus@m.15510
MVKSDTDVDTSPEKEDASNQGEPTKAATDEEETNLLADEPATAADVILGLIKDNNRNRDVDSDAVALQQLNRAIAMFRKTLGTFLESHCGTILGRLEHQLRKRFRRHQARASPGKAIEEEVYLARCDVPLVTEEFSQQLTKRISQEIGGICENLVQQMKFQRGISCDKLEKQRIHARIELRNQLLKFKALYERDTKKKFEEYEVEIVRLRDLARIQQIKAKADREMRLKEGLSKAMKLIDDSKFTKAGDDKAAVKAGLKAELTSLMDNMCISTMTRPELEDVATNKTAELFLATKRLQAVENELRGAQSAYYDVSDQLAGYKEKLSSSQNELSLLKHDYSRVESSVVYYEDECDVMRQKIETLEREVEVARGAQHDSSMELEKLRMQSEVDFEKIQHMQDTIADLENESKQSRDMVLNLRESLANYQDLVKVKEAQIADLTADCGSLMRANQDLNSDIDRINSVLKDLHGYIESQADQLKGRGEINMMLKLEMKRMKQAMEDKDLKLKTYNDYVENLEVAREDESRQFQRDMENKEKSVYETRMSFKRELDEVKAETKKIKAELRQEKQRAKEAQEKLQKEIEAQKVAMKSDLSKKENELKFKYREMEKDLEKKAISAERKSKEAQQQLRSAMSELQTLREQVLDQQVNPMRKDRRQLEQLCQAFIKNATGQAIDVSDLIQSMEAADFTATGSPAMQCSSDQNVINTWGTPPLPNRPLPTGPPGSPGYSPGQHGHREFGGGYNAFAGISGDLPGMSLTSPAAALGRLACTPPTPSAYGHMHSHSRTPMPGVPGMYSPDARALSPSLPPFRPPTVDAPRTAGQMTHYTIPGSPPYGRPYTQSSVGRLRPIMGGKEISPKKAVKKLQGKKD